MQSFLMRRVRTLLSALPQSCPSDSCRRVMRMQGLEDNIVRFRSRAAVRSPHQDQSCLMEAVYAAGSLPVLAHDSLTKRLAARLHLFGFVLIEEMNQDGSARFMPASETIFGCLKYPWRISKRRDIAQKTLYNGA
jgi:hypothetical protein